MKMKSRRKRFFLAALNLTATVAMFGCNGGGLVGLQTQSPANLEEFVREFAREALAAFLL